MKWGKGNMTLRILALSLFLVVSGCGEEPMTNAPAPVAKKVRPVQNVQEVPTPESAVPEIIFSYNPIGQRDPFESLLKEEQEAREVDVPRTPLEKFDLGQFRIQAILIGKGAPRAMVSAPDGKNYILKPGLKIGKNNGVIKDITRSAVIVEESNFDLTGNMVKGIQSITVPEHDKL